MSTSFSDIIGYSHACALEALSDYWLEGEANTEDVFNCCREYSENCRKSNAVYVAATVEEILFGWDRR